MASRINIQELLDHIDEEQWLYANHQKVRMTIENVRLDQAVQKHLFGYKMFAPQIAQFQQMEQELLIDCLASDAVDDMLFKKLVTYQHMTKAAFNIVLTKNTARLGILFLAQGKYLSDNFEVCKSYYDTLVSSESTMAVINICRDFPSLVSHTIGVIIAHQMNEFLHTFCKKVYFSDEAVDHLTTFMGVMSDEYRRVLFDTIVGSNNCSDYKKAELLLLL